MNRDRDAVRTGDDVLFSCTATIVNSATKNGTVEWIQVRTQAGRIKFVSHDLFNHVGLELRPWPSSDVHLSFAGRVKMPIYKDGELVALQIQSKSGRITTVRFSEYGDLVFTTIADTARSAA